jgi:Zn-dependent alcohol dehydrogenase
MLEPCVALSITEKMTQTTALIAPALDGSFELKEVHLDSLQPDEALIEIHASGICHTDLSCASGKLPCAPNAVLGHEGSSCYLLYCKHMC